MSQKLGRTPPNHALQRTAPCVTAPASAAFPPTVHLPRRTPLSLSLGSLGPEGNIMNKRFFPTIFCVSLMLLTSSDKQQGQPQVAAPANNVHPVAQDAKDDTGPSSRSKAWSLRGRRGV